MPATNLSQRLKYPPARPSETGYLRLGREDFTSNTPDGLADNSSLAWISFKKFIKLNILKCIPVLYHSLDCIHDNKKFHTSFCMIVRDSTCVCSHIVGLLKLVKQARICNSLSDWTSSSDKPMSVCLTDGLQPRCKVGCACYRVGLVFHVALKTF